MTSWRKKQGSSATLASVTIVFTPCSTSLRQQVTRESGQLVHSQPRVPDFAARDSLRELDIELMRRLAPRVNVIPVIGKSDTLTPSELAKFKRRVMEDIEHYAIPVFNFPYDVEEDDEETIVDNSELRALMPFAIVGSEDEVEVNGEMVRARRYPWGIVEVDNPQHSDVQRLRAALLNTHLTDLKEITHDYLYENWRTETLSRSQGPDYEVQHEELSSKLKEDQLRAQGKCLFMLTGERIS